MGVWITAGAAALVGAVQLQATTVREFPAPDADQGAAVDAEHVYVVDNSVIAKHRRSDGEMVARVDDGPLTLLEHMNSCFHEDGQLWCANSNYSETPMASSVEVFDAATLTHVRSHPLGVRDEGSLTWFDRLGGGWLAAFAHYDGDDGGLAFKGHRFTTLATLDEEWRVTGGWMLPNSVLARLEPDSASGGQIGPDGLLYILGHDKPEMYVLAKPVAGPKLIHVATIDVELEGQAFSFDPVTPRRIVGIDRRRGYARIIDLPEVPLEDPLATPFR